MNKQRKELTERKELINPDFSIHLYDIATSPLGKKLSRAGYVDSKHLEAMLHLFGLDLRYEYWVEELAPDAQRRSDYGSAVFTGGVLYIGKQRTDTIWKYGGLANLHKFCYGDKVGEMFDLIVNKGKE